MDKQEFEAYMATDRRISKFCNNVLLKLEDEYEGILEGTDCCLEDITFTDSHVYVEYSFKPDEDVEFYTATLILTIDQLLREDVDACAAEIANDILTS